MLTIKTTSTFDLWFAALTDVRAQARVQARIDRAEGGNFGDCEPIGEGCSEMRIHYGPGYRVYYTFKGKTLILLLCGGVKSTQSEDIRLAAQIAASWEE